MNDLVGRFFEIMADRRSEYIDIRYAFSGAGKKPLQRTVIPHSRADGIAGLHEFLHLNGFELEYDGHRPVHKKPHLLRRIRLLGCSLADKGPYGYPAAAGFHGLAEKFSGSHVPVAAAHLVFTAIETRRIAEAARAKHVSVNSYLLGVINRVVQASMTHGVGPLIWFIPVDLRPWLPHGARQGNVLSNLFVPLGSEASVQEVHAQIQSMLSKGVHWHSWIKMKLATRLGLFERLLKRPRKTEFHLHSGKKLCFTFSNLGKWRATAVSGKNRNAPPVLFFPPPNTPAPASIGAVTVNGRLTLTLQVHPAISQTSRDLEKILRAIRATLINY